MRYKVYSKVAVFYETEVDADNAKDAWEQVEYEIAESHVDHNGDFVIESMQVEEADDV